MNTLRRFCAWILILSVVVLATGCTNPRHQREAKAKPEPSAWYPEWAYDAPYYFKPATEGELRAMPGNRPDDAAHFYTNKPLIEIARPQNGVIAERIPRVGVYWTDTNGYYWQLAGYFGIGQTHFALPVKGDGDYGIRFVGPGLPASKTNPSPPHRVYHVDMTPPKMTVDVSPERQWYAVGEIVTVNWTATDPNLVEKPVRVAVCWDAEGPILEAKASARPNARWQMLPAQFERDGTVAYTIPSDAMGQAVRIQVIATDRAGNVGKAQAALMQVTGVPVDNLPAEPGKPESEPKEGAVSPPIQAQAPKVQLVPLADAAVASVKSTRRFEAKNTVRFVTYAPQSFENLPSFREADDAARSIDVQKLAVPVPSVPDRKEVSQTVREPLMRLARTPLYAPGQRYGLHRPWEKLQSDSSVKDRMTWRLPGTGAASADARAWQ